MTAREYGDFLKTYQAKYGPSTTVFMQVGSFYELYDFQDPNTGKTLYNVIEIVDILGLQTSAKTDAQSGHTILTAGLPDYALHRWAAKLTQMGWTVIIVDQNKDSTGRVKSRTVSRILSPGTHIETVAPSETPSIISLLLQGSRIHNEPPAYSVASLDLTTGHTRSFISKTEGTPDTWTADYLQQFLCIYPPKELIIHIWADSTCQIPKITDENFRRQFGIPHHVPVHIRALSPIQIETLMKQLYRDEQLRTIYSLKSILPPQTLLSLRSPLEESSIILLAEYAEEHVSTQFKKFQKNEAWHPQQNLICANNALLQLQIVSQQQPQGFAATAQSQTDSILTLFSPAITPMGKRAVRERIARPLSDAALIRQRHRKIEQFQNLHPDTIRNHIIINLRFMYDLPRLHRKILCGNLSREDVPLLIQSYSAISALIQLTEKLEKLSCNGGGFFEAAQWQTYCDAFFWHFPIQNNDRMREDETAAAKLAREFISDKVTPFHKENYPILANIESEIHVVVTQLIEIRNQFANIAAVSQDAIRIETREKEPFGLKTSTVILKSIETKKKNETDATVTLHKITTSALKSGGWLYCQELQELNIRLLGLYEKLDRECRLALIEACQKISDEFLSEPTNICSAAENWIEDMDCTVSFARTAEERGWVRPEIVESEGDAGSAGSSFLEIYGLRHPIVEASRSRIAYVTHDVALGGTGATHGWLIYGMNASGKSTLMKATGIAVILAQSGCYVPARSMRLAPFRAIFTRILNHDNIFQGLSSFAVEMSELRDILATADDRSLVLGDELCAGTESDSAQALVAAGIQWLAKKRAKFLFATHLHDIPKLIDIQSLGVSVWHIHVHYDAVTKKLIYDRQLREGSGSSLYGLEVARAMNLPYEFIQTALANRNRLVGEFRRTESVKTAWTEDLVKKTCELCGIAGVQRHLEVHHIQHRASAKNGRLATGEDMNHPRNLVVLCDKCHDKQHESQNIAQDSDTSDDSTPRQSQSQSRAKSVISSIQLTSDGPERQNIIVPVPPSQRTKISGKWSNEQILLIQQTLSKFPKASLKNIKFILQNNHAIAISEASLRQFRTAKSE